MPEIHIVLPEGTANIPHLVSLVDGVAKTFSPEARVITVQPVDAVLPQVTVLTPEQVALQRMAQRFADAILAAPGKTAWRRYLINLTLGGNTCESISLALADGFRPEAASFSRHMRKMLPDDVGCQKPAELLATHRRTYYADGCYKGIEYAPRPLGRLIYEILKREGYFD